MATLSYSSFPGPRVADEICSSSVTSSRSSCLASVLTHAQLSLMDAAVPIDLNVAHMLSDTAVEDEDDDGDDSEDGLSSLDVGYRIAPTTPTKGRTRRATMPDSMKPVHPSPSPQPLLHSPVFEMIPICCFGDADKMCSSPVSTLLQRLLEPR